MNKWLWLLWLLKWQRAQSALNISFRFVFSVNNLTSINDKFILQLKCIYLFYLFQTFLKSPELWIDSSDLMHTSHWVSSSWGFMLWLCAAGLWLLRVWHSNLTESRSSCRRLRSCCALYSCSCRFRCERWDCWDTWRSLALYRCFSSVTSFSQSRCFSSKTYRRAQTEFWILMSFLFCKNGNVMLYFLISFIFQNFQVCLCFSVFNYFFVVFVYGLFKII